MCSICLNAVSLLFNFNMIFFSYTITPYLPWMVVMSKLQRTTKQNWKKIQLLVVSIFSFLCLGWIWMNSFLFCFTFCVSCSTIFKTHSLSVWDLIFSRLPRILTCREFLSRQDDSIISLVSFITTLDEIFLWSVSRDCPYHPGGQGALPDSIFLDLCTLIYPI